MNHNINNNNNNNQQYHDDDDDNDEELYHTVHHQSSFNVQVAPALSTYENDILFKLNTQAVDSTTTKKTTKNMRPGVTRIVNNHNNNINNNNTYCKGSNNIGFVNHVHVDPNLYNAEAEIVHKLSNASYQDSSSSRGNIPYGDGGTNGSNNISSTTSTTDDDDDDDIILKEISTTTLPDTLDDYEASIRTKLQQQQDSGGCVHLIASNRWNVQTATTTTNSLSSSTNMMVLIDEILQTYENDIHIKQQHMKELLLQEDDDDAVSAQTVDYSDTFKSTTKNATTLYTTTVPENLHRLEARVGAHASNNTTTFQRPSLIIPSLSHRNMDEENLVVATEVTNDTILINGQQQVPIRAIQYNPDDSMYKNRRRRVQWCCLCTIILTTVIVMTVIVIGIFLVLVERSQSQVIQYRTSIGIRETIERVIDIEHLNDISHPYRKALDWIMYIDDMELTPSSSTQFFQRYILVYLYYATSTTGPWTSDCAPINNGQNIDDTKNDDCTHIFPFDKYNPDGITSRLPSVRWLSNTDECRWAGITCDRSNQIVDISLSDVGMTGSFPEGISHLPYLNYLGLIYGKLEGPLPHDLLNRMKHLSKVVLRDNIFTGTIPDTWYEHPTLVYLNVGNNQLSGPLSTNIIKAENMRHFDVANNIQTGTIPIEISDMINLNEVVLRRNDFNGTIPDTIGKLQYLQVFDLSGNTFTGSLPNSIGTLKRLKDLFLYENLFTGTIPKTFWDNTDVTHIRINQNQFNGTISNAISKLIQLHELDISMNQFTGTIPSRLPKSYLQTIRASGNHLHGTIDTPICNLIDQFVLKDLELDCAVDTKNDGSDAFIAPEVNCTCCTVCCNTDGEDCFTQQK